MRANLLCVTWSAARGYVFLFDIAARQRVSAWTLPSCAKGFSDAAGVAMDPHFNLFVADPHNDRVRHFSAFGRHLGDFGRSAPAVGDAGRDRAGVLDRPHAVVVRGDTVFIAMGDRPRRHGVQRFRRGGQAAGPIHSHGDIEQAFAAPRALWIDAGGLLVADTLAGRLQRFRGDGTFVAAMACAERGAMSRPVAVLRRADGSILIVDRGDDAGPRLFGPDGQRRPLPAALAEQCQDAVAFAVDERERLYVLDRHGERVQRFTVELEFDRPIVDLAEHFDEFEAGKRES